MPAASRPSVQSRARKFVYLRFDLTGSQTFADDIILDQTCPAVVRAKVIRRSRVIAAATAIKKRCYPLRLKARDNVSGVTKLRLMVKKGTPRKLRKYNKTFVVKVPRAKKAIRVRVQDGAGNYSKWRTVRLFPRR